MHPRTIVREEIKALLQSVVDVPVYAARSREVSSRVRSYILVYVTSEGLSRLDNRPLSPIARDMTVEIVVATQGGDESQSTASDDLCREIETAMSRDYDIAAPVSTQILYDPEGTSVSTIVAMRYSVEIQDNLGA